MKNLFKNKHIIITSICFVLIASFAKADSFGKSAFSILIRQTSQDAFIEEETEDVYVDSAEDKWEMNTPYDYLINHYGYVYDIHPSLIKSIILNESNFNQNAVSPKGAVGLMQLMPATAEELGVYDRKDPEQNISGGVKYFRSLLDEFNDLSLALAAYNAGPCTVRSAWEVPKIAETQRFVKNVVEDYLKLME